MHLAPYGPPEKSAFASLAMLLCGSKTNLCARLPCRQASKLLQQSTTNCRPWTSKQTNLTRPCTMHRQSARNRKRQPLTGTVCQKCAGNDFLKQNAKNKICGIRPKTHFSHANGKQVRALRHFHKPSSKKTIYGGLDL